MSLLQEKRQSMREFLQGKKSLGVAFWGFGFFGSLLISIFIGIPLCLAIGYLFKSTFEHAILGLVLMTPFNFLVWIIMSIGVWRSGKTSTSLWRWISRATYIGLGGIFYLGIFLAVLMPFIRKK